MDKEIKERWVESLESGKYKQGISRLRSRKNEFCCLGVLCDIYDPERWSPLYGMFSLGNEERCYMKVHSTGLPYEVQSWAGLTFDEALDLARFNDSGYSFTEVAEKIRETL